MCVASFSAPLIYFSLSVFTIVALFGTVDLIYMHTDKQTPADSAQTVAACECEFTNAAAPDGMNTLYIIRGYNSRITETEYTQIEAKDDGGNGDN